MYKLLQELFAELVEYSCACSAAWSTVMLCCWTHSFWQLSWHIVLCIKTLDKCHC